MSLKIIRSDPDATGGDFFTLKQRLWKTNDDRLVPEGHPDAAFLFGTVGQKVSLARARRYGLVSDDAPVKTEEPAAEVTAVDPAAEVVVEPISTEVVEVVEVAEAATAETEGEATAATEAAPDATPEGMKTGADPETKDGAPAETKVVELGGKKRKRGRG